MIEKAQHLQAFERYYAMGTKRSYTKLAEELEVHPNTVGGWAKDFNWDAKIEQRDRVYVEKLQRDNALEFDKAVVFYQKGIRTLIKKGFLDKLQIGDLPFEIKTPRDLEILIKAEILLAGGVTERTGVVDEDKRKPNEKAVIDMVKKDPNTWEALNQQYLEGDVQDERRNGDN